MPLVAAPPTSRCVCLSSGHCWYCLDNGRRCDRPECRCTCADGARCGRVLPVRQGGSPALPLPVLGDGTSDETIAPVALTPRVCTTSEGLEAALRESLAVARPLAPWASKPPARHAMARDLTVELDAHERALHRRPRARRSAEVSS